MTEQELKALCSVLPPLVGDRLVNQNSVIEAARELVGGEGACFGAQEVRTLIDIADDRARLLGRFLHDVRARFAQSARAQPFFDTHTGMRQAWVREEIARRIEGDPEVTTELEAARLAKATLEGRG